MATSEALATFDRLKRAFIGPDPLEWYPAPFQLMVRGLAELGFRLSRRGWREYTSEGICLWDWLESKQDHPSEIHPYTSIYCAGTPERWSPLLLSVC